MGVRVIGNPSAIFPLSAPAPIIELKKSWEDSWSFAPDLEFVSCGLHASSTAVSQMIFQRRFGTRTMPFEGAFSIVDGVNYERYWARLSIVGDGGRPIPQFIGQIEAGGTDMQGSVTVQAGAQSFVAYGGLRTLQRVQMDTAFFVNPTSAPSEVQWVPPMNSKDRRHLLVGNAADAGDGTQTKMYGGTDVWTHLEYLEYALVRFVQQASGPKWTIGGQSDILKQMKTTIDFSEGTRISDVLRQLIPVKYGVDYFVASTDAGFEIRVFSLSDRSQAFGGATLPRNPNNVRVVRSEQPELKEITVVESAERRVDRIEIRGKRIVVCGTLRGPSGGGGTETGGQSLVARWPSSLEDRYKDGDGLVSGGQTDVTKVDEARQREKFGTVFAALGAPSDWDMDGGIWSVACNDDGTITTGPFQVAQRETLGYIPLKVGFDYTTDPATDNTDGAITPDIQFPLAWLIDEQNNIPGSSGGYFQCDLHGVSLHHPYHDWGIVLKCSHNHTLGLNHFTIGASSPSDYLPLYDYETAIATIAIESDHRIRLAYDVPSPFAAGDGSAIVVTDEGAELWVLLAHTVVGQRAEDGFPVTSGDSQRVLRNDIERLGLLACGTIARYIASRFRVQMNWKGHQPWGDLLGQMVTEIRGGSYWQAFGAPITSIEWSVGKEPRTVVKCGYA